MIVVDTSGLLGALFADQRSHEACARALRASAPPLLVTPFVLAELDYLVARLAGLEAELDLLAEIAGGAYDLVPFSAADIGQCRSVVRRYADLQIGLADASIIVAARRFGARQVLTLDERHFRVLPGPDGNPLEILPADFRD